MVAPRDFAAGFPALRDVSESNLMPRRNWFWFALACGACGRAPAAPDVYEGPGKLDARLYVLDSPAVALELAQRWRPSADTVFFYSGRFFAVVKWQDADRIALKAFVAEVQKRFGKPKEGA